MDIAGKIAFDNPARIEDVTRAFLRYSGLGFLKLKEIQYSKSFGFDNPIVTYHMDLLERVAPPPAYNPPELSRLGTRFIFGVKTSNNLNKEYSAVSKSFEVIVDEAYSSQIDQAKMDVLMFKVKKRLDNPNYIQRLFYPRKIPDALLNQNSAALQ